MSEEVTLDEFVESTDRDSVFGSLPSHWGASALDDSTLFNSTSSGLEQFSGTKTYVPTAGVEGGQIVDDDGEITYENRPSRANLETDEGDVLFAKMKDSVKVIKSSGEITGNIIFSTGFIRVSTNNGVNSEFLKQIFLSNKFNQNKDSLAIGSTQPAIRLSDLSALTVPVPPIQEQRKIATVLHDVDQAIQKSKDIIQEYKKVGSKLSENLVFRGINNDKYKNVRLGPKQVEVPSDWRISSFGDISDVQQGLQIAKSERFRENNEDRYQYITVQYLNDPQDHANNWFIENPRDTVVCNKEDVLMTRTGNTGEVVTGVEGAFHNNFFKIEFDRNMLLRDYLVHYLESKAIQDVLISYAGTTTIPDLNHGEFFNIPVLLPPIDEQKLIAEKAEEMSEIVSVEEEHLNRLQRLKQGLMQDLLSGTVRVTDTNIQVPDEITQHG